ncbi:MAG: 6,7-dimethyl-8-ribityllumazine synthase [Ktedonobacteraceae bacterium]|nr:6,7-dimethyl-8-ribityllumazine synthase [Ktedonobacteraceae bacterium]
MLQPLKQSPGVRSSPVGLKVAIMLVRSQTQQVRTMFSLAYEVLLQHGVAADAIDIMNVPDWSNFARATRDILDHPVYNVVICLACSPQTQVMQHLPFHKATANEWQWMALYRKTPVVFGIVDTGPQPARELALRGEQCAHAALELAQRTRGQQPPLVLSPWDATL